MTDYTLNNLFNDINKVKYNNSSSFKTVYNIQKELSIFFGNISIKKIDTDKVISYIEYLKAKSNKARTINTKTAILIASLQFAFIRKKIDIMPKRLLLKPKNNKELIISKKDILRILKYFKQNNENEVRLIILLCYYTGARIRNILNLKSDDIKGGYIFFNENKSNRPYAIPIKKLLVNALSTFKRFSIKYDTLYYKFDIMRKTLNLNNITIHTLRHTFCSNLIQKNIPLPIVQKLANHKNINTTMRYIHIKNEQLEHAIACL